MTDTGRKEQVETNNCDGAGKTTTINMLTGMYDMGGGMASIKSNEKSSPSQFRRQKNFDVSGKTSDNCLHVGCFTFSSRVRFWTI